MTGKFHLAELTDRFRSSRGQAASIIKKRSLRFLVYGILIPGLLTIALFPRMIHGPLNPVDEGVWLAALEARALGRHPFSDVAFYYGPLLLEFIQAFVRNQGMNLAAYRTAVWLVNLGGILGAYGALLRFVRSPLVRLCGGVALWLIPAIEFTHFPFSARYGLPLLSLVLWPSDRPADVDSPVRSICAAASGAAAIIALFISVEVGVAVLIAGTVVHALHPLRRRLLPSFFAGILLSTGGLVFVLGWTKVCWPYFMAAVEIPRRFNYGIGRLPWPTVPPWHERATLPESPDIAHLFYWTCLVNVWAFYWPPAIYAAALAWSAKHRSTAASAVAAGLACCGGVAAATSAWGRSDRFHIFYAFSIAIILAAYLAERMQRNPSAWMRALGLIWLTLTSVLLTCEFNASRVLRAAVMSVCRPTGILRAGNVRLPSSQARRYQVLADWAAAHVAPREPVLFFSADAAEPFMTDRPFVGHHVFLVNAGIAGDDDNTVRALDRGPVRWAVVDRNGAFFGIPIRQFLPKLSAAILRDYRPVETQDAFIFFERRAPGLR